MRISKSAWLCAGGREVEVMARDTRAFWRVKEKEKRMGVSSNGGDQRLKRTCGSSKSECKRGTCGGEDRCLTCVIGGFVAVWRCGGVAVKSMWRMLQQSFFEASRFHRPTGHAVGITHIDIFTSASARTVQLVPYKAAIFAISIGPSCHVMRLD